MDMAQLEALTRCQDEMRTILQRAGELVQRRDSGLGLQPNHVGYHQAVATVAVGLATLYALEKRN